MARRQADRATRATPQAASRLDHPASIPRAFTPGPWWGGVISKGQPIAQQILDEFAEQRGGTLGAVTSGGDRFLAFVASTPGTLTEDHANARLIAAAPDLYAALEESTRALEIANDMLGTNYGGRSECVDNGIANNRALLAKASGTLTEGGDAKQAPGESLSGPTAESGGAHA